MARLGLCGVRAAVSMHDRLERLGYNLVERELRVRLLVDLADEGTANERMDAVCETGERQNRARALAQESERIKRNRVAARTCCRHAQYRGRGRPARVREHKKMNFRPYDVARRDEDCASKRTCSTPAVDEKTRS